MSKLKNDSTYKKSSLVGCEATGKTQKPKGTEKAMARAVKNNNKAGKKV